MPRTLPWLVGQNDTERVKRESTSRNLVKTEPGSARDDQTPKKIPSSPNKRDFFRSSQTPPTSPIRRCPSEEFLIGGLDNDDAWIMVEDEFYVVAQTFTQHLHYAEYVRRTKEVKAKKAMGMEDLERPTDGKTTMSKALQRRKEAEALDARQKAGLQETASLNHDEKEDTEEDDTWAGTHLHNLMTSPRKSRSLMSVHAMKASTRAAAGFGQTASSNSGRARTSSRGEPGPSSKAEAAQRMKVDNEETTSGEDDDLDLEATTPVAIPPTKCLEDVAGGTCSDRRRWSPHETRSKGKVSNLSTSKISGKSAPASANHPPANSSKSKVQMLFDDLDELQEPSRHNLSISDRKRGPPSTRGSLEESLADNNNLEPKKTRTNEVPKFLG